MRPVVYLGPSLPISEARRVLDADYRPPVKRGDLTELDDVDVVAIIDGVFLQHCSVGHREILRLLERKVRVIGGGSMGALRAAEMRGCGMIGLGRIFEAYVSGEIEGDDEVALVFDPETMEPLSEPLVNMRFLLEEARNADVIDGSQMEAIMSELRSLYYPRRTISAFLEIVHKIIDEPLNERRVWFDDFFVRNYKDIKKEDALTVIKYLKQMTERAC